MSKLSIANRRSRSVALAFSLAMLSCSCIKEMDQKIDFELTGRVVDKETMQPIEGAYAVAIYKIQRATRDGVTSHCTKTRGMVTGTDGAFHFPVEKLDNYSPSHVALIHLDYSATVDVPVEVSVMHKPPRENYSDRKVLMEKQRYGKDFDYLNTGVYDCTYAETPQDAAAGAEFVRREIAQLKKYGREDRIKDYLRTLRRLEEADGYRVKIDTPDATDPALAKDSKTQ